MRNKSPPTSTHRQNVERLDAFIEPKNSIFKSALTSIRQQVIGAYQEYENEIRDLSSVDPLGYVGDQKNALVSCYTQKTDMLSEVKSEVKPQDSSIDFLSCPYCQIGHTKQFDHFLPKSIFSEFSVLPKNLIFVCKDCNEEKSNNCYGENRVFNPYFDPIPSEQFLFCDLDEATITVTFYLQKHSTMSEEQFSLFENHFRELDLEERFMTECTIKLGEHKGSWKQMLLGGEREEAVIKHASMDLQARIDYLENIHGINYFHSIFLRAVKDNINEIVRSV